MSAALVVGGDYIDGIKQVLVSYGINEVSHWPGRKAGDSKKVIPHNTQLIVLVTDWIGHSFTRKIKLNAAKRGIRVVYTPNGPAALRARLDRINQDLAMESDCWVYSSNVFKNFIHRISTYFRSSLWQFTQLMYATSSAVKSRKSLLAL